jgi:hypothetical protein
MSAAAKTIAFLRTLTNDHLLSVEEVWALAKFFNDNPECTEEWPGDLLAPMLASAFDDAAISEEEMQALASTMASVEEEWAGRNSNRASRGDSGPMTLQIEKALMPQIELRMDVPSQREDAVYLVCLHEHTCTCPEFRRRQAVPSRHPSRCCRHMAYAFTRSGKVFQPWFQALLDDCFAKARGTQVGCEWVLLEIMPRRPVLLAGGGSAWCTVFAPGGEGYESFAFHPAQARWSYGDAPSNALLIEQAIRESFMPAHF